MEQMFIQYKLYIFICMYTFEKDIEIEKNRRMRMILNVMLKKENVELIKGLYEDNIFCVSRVSLLLI